MRAFAAIVSAFLAAIATARETPSPLAQAVVDLFPEVVVEELKKGADPNQELNGDPLVQKAVGFSPENPLWEKLSPEERTRRIGEVLAALFEGGADPNRPGRFGQTFLTTLVHEHGDASFVELAVRHGAKVDGADAQGDSPVHLAATWPTMLAALLDHGADPGLAHPKSGKTPLMLAAAEPSVAAVEILLKSGASAKALDRRGRNAFHHLALRVPQGPEENEPLNEIAVACAGLFEGAGADFRLPDNEGTTAFHLAASNPAPGLLKWCLGRERVPLEKPDGKGRTPLVRALEAIELENIRVLLAAGARVPATGLLAPVARAHHESRISPETYVTILKSMGELQDDPDLPGADGWTALMWAASSDVVDAVSYLIEEGADIGKRARDGRSSLHFAAAAGALQTVSLLLERGADAGAVDKEGATPAHWALRWGHPLVAERLLAAMPVSPETLRLALEAGSAPAVNRILDAEPGWTHAEIEGSPPLHHAVEGRHPGLVALLIERGADENALDRSRMTPLGRAVVADSEEIVELLLEAGANPADFAADGSALVRAADANRSVLLEVMLQSLPAPLGFEDSARLLQVAIRKDDLALFRFLLHHERLQFAAGKDEIPAGRDDAFLFAARSRSDRWLRELVAKTRWQPAPDDLALNGIWLTAVVAESVPVAKYLHETFSVDVGKTAGQRGLRMTGPGGPPDPFGEPVSRGSVPSGAPPLLIALKSWDEEMANYLRSEGAGLDGNLDGNGKELSSLATNFAIHGESGLLAHTLDFLPTPDLGDPSLLMLAASAGHSECVALLLGRGADPARRDREGKSVLDRALAGGDGESIRMVREALP